MILIEKLSDMIEEEMDDAEKYIRCAMNHKESRPLLAEVFYKLSTEEMQHMSLLHDQVAKLIEEYRKEHGDPPADMKAIYEHLHSKHIAKATAIKNMQMIYKAGAM